MSGDKIGMQVTSVFRNLLNYHASLDWAECVRLGEIFNDKLQEADWLEDDYGRTFDLTFEPRSMREK